MAFYYCQNFLQNDSNLTHASPSINISLYYYESANILPNEILRVNDAASRCISRRLRPKQRRSQTYGSGLYHSKKHYTRVNQIVKYTLQTLLSKHSNILASCSCFARSKFTLKVQIAKNVSYCLWIQTLFNLLLIEILKLWFFFCFKAHKEGRKQRMSSYIYLNCYGDLKINVLVRTW